MSFITCEMFGICKFVEKTLVTVANKVVTKISVQSIVNK